MKIVLLESLSVSKECMKKYTDILEQEGHSFQCYERNDDPEVQIQEIGDADVYKRQPLGSTHVKLKRK